MLENCSIGNLSFVCLKIIFRFFGSWKRYWCCSYVKCLKFFLTTLQRQASWQMVSFLRLCQHDCCLSAFFLQNYEYFSEWFLVRTKKEAPFFECRIFYIRSALLRMSDFRHSIDRPSNVEYSTSEVRPSNFE